MIYTIKMNDTLKEKLLTSLFQIPELYRTRLAEIAASESNGQKSSINTCILTALGDYLGLPFDKQPVPELPKGPLRAFTVRTPGSLKRELTICAANWQLKTSLPVSMNAVLNTAVLAYIQKHVPLK